ncbi:LacI family DNA-binding transcriptional regulator [Candidatus Enterococcus willemsii]|uniref:LacI family transcriptional regulator n=1 Tax=Candidatus Enterococcus willemsii TaxID=1857215 RepID=A0ABQ6Z0X9_9ENTE|nr:LacI family DNA-binding transcriptional regulator [Enterococcus sp. CU12B]KAF1304944.1 LacI family transcriptional regulator [Enterococcus sp. CU12B]
MATIREVAKEAGVSIGTVSRYLNGHQLKKNNMENIQRAIEKFGYEENIIAKGLKNNRSMSVGVLVNSLTDVFATSIVSSLENYLEKNNYSLLLCDYQNDYQRLERKLEFLKSRSVDGVVIFHLEKNLPILEKLRSAGIAIIAVDSPIKGFKTDTVLVDNYQSSYNVVDKFFDEGHEKIGIIAGDTTRYIGLERLNGYIDSMKEKNIFSEELIVMGDYTKEAGYLGAMKLLEKTGITALYSTNYYMTLGAVQALLEKEKKIPEDISVIGFDHFELSDIIQPKLTVVEQPIQEIGEMVGQLIMDNLKGKKRKHFTTIELETTLLWRASVKKNEKTLAND